MENVSGVGKEDDQMDLPPGFRFHPTDEEIVTYFLERKMCGLDFPAHTIADVVDVCKYEPWDLPRKYSMV